MSRTNGALFRVELLPRARNDIIQLIKNLTGLEKGARLDSLSTIQNTLEHRPTEWGDPVRNSRRPGGRVYRAILEDLVVYYLVFRDNQTVFVISIEVIKNK